jgi:hypothetical protein
MPRNNPEDLEKFIHQTLRALPERRAPRSLEARVFAAIAARQALPWWRQSFTHWPLAARGAFLVVSAVLAAALLAWFFRTSGQVESGSLLAGPLAMVAKIHAISGGVGAFLAVVMRSIPSLWLYGALAFVATMYAAFFGLSAAAYRSFFAQR